VGITAAKQVITTVGDLRITGNPGDGVLSGARIGGAGGAGVAGPSDMTLRVGGDLLLTAGGTNNPATLGAPTPPAGVAPPPHVIDIQAQGDVILRASAKSGVRIGTSLLAPSAGTGNISITAGRSIQLHGVDPVLAPAGIRTASDVALAAGTTILETGSGTILANRLTTTSSGDTSLTGPNAVSSFNGTSGGGLSLTNTGALTVTGLFAGGNATLNNAGDITVTGPWNSLAATSIATTGTGSDLTVNSFVNSGGPMTLDVGGALRVAASGMQDASLTSSGGQSIAAGSVEVRSRDGRSASINNNVSGDQAITVSGGAGIDVVSESGFASISQNAAGLAQTITAINADHISLNGAGGNAFISANGGAQTLSITGSGSNAIRLGSAAALGFSQIAGSSTQNVTAGLTGEQGSITIVGPAGNNAAASIVSRSGPGGTQTIATSGALGIAGGTAANGFGSGIFHNGSGLQKVTAANIALQGGSAGNGNAAQIGSFGGGVPANAGDQEINVAGGAITIVGGAAGSNNRALILSSGNQTINGNPDITLQGGASGSDNGVGIIASGLTKTQTIHAKNIALVSGSGGVNNSVAISAPKQLINTTGDLTMTGGASIGQFSGTRIGGLGGNTLSATDLTMNIGGNLLMSGGSAQFNGASIGSTLSSPALPNSITINAVGDVVLNSGTAAGARIGSSTFSDELAQGAISITAGRSIQLNGNSAVAPTAIRTLGNVTLSAGSTLSEGSHGRIEAASLVTISGGDTSLTGPNQVASFTASTTTGNVSLRNTAPVLTLGSMELPGSLSIVQAGTLSIPGTVSALSHAIDATGDVLVGSASATNAALLYASGDISITTPGAVIVRGSDVTPLAASAVLADGDLQVAAGNVSIMGGGALLAPAAMRGEAVQMTIGGELTVTGGSGHLSPAVLSSGSNIDLTVGTAVRVTEGKGLLSVARIQTEIKDGVIHISFPNLEEGGYFVNGIEGKTHHGQTGFFTLNKPAKVGKTLLLEYGD
jgi:hypothetical protein